MFLLWQVISILEIATETLVILSILFIVTLYLILQTYSISNYLVLTNRSLLVTLTMTVTQIWSLIFSSFNLIWLKLITTLFYNNCNILQIILLSLSIFLSLKNSFKTKDILLLKIVKKKKNSHLILLKALEV